MSQKTIKALFAILAAGGLALSARAQINNVFAVEFNQSDNRVGWIDLVTGNFSQLSTVGNTMINDIAYSPADGSVYGIRNLTDLVKFDTTNGAMTVVGTFNTSGLESLAFRPDGTLFACTQSGLYTIDPSTAQATSIGAFGAAPYLNDLGQNIRFGPDGNLYVSNTRADTDIYQVSMMDGSATWVGEVAGAANLVIENAGLYLYGVWVNVRAGGESQPQLLSFDMSSFLTGGTNADGTVHQILTTQVAPGPIFPSTSISRAIIPP